MNQYSLPIGSGIRPGKPGCHVPKSLFEKSFRFIHFRMTRDRSSVLERSQLAFDIARVDWVESNPLGPSDLLDLLV